MRQVKTVEKRIEVPDWRSKEYDRITRAITSECQRHTPQPSGSWTPGFSGPIRFFCTVCRSGWPCGFLRWASRALDWQKWDAPELVYDPQLPTADEDE